MPAWMKASGVSLTGGGSSGGDSTNGVVLDKLEQLEDKLEDLYQRMNEPKL